MEEISEVKPQLETIQLSDSKNSFRVFRQEYNGFESYWHYHPEIELTYIQSGSGLRFVGDSIAPYETGDLTLLGEHLPHNYVAANKNPENNEIAYVIQFPAEIFDQIKECRPLFEMFSRAKYGINFKDPPAELLFKISDLTSLPPLKRFVELLDILNHLSDLRESSSLSSVSFGNTKGLQKQQNRISKVTAYIIDNYHKNITLRQAANVIGMTPTAFSRWFKQSVGKTFISYLNSIRIERACQQLIQTDLTVKQIAFKCGFESIGNFNRTFKKHKLDTPLFYRKMHEMH